MLICNQHSFLCIHVPKNAGLSITSSLKNSIYSRPEYFIRHKIIFQIHKASDGFIYYPYHQLMNQYFPNYLTLHATAIKIKSVIGNERFNKLFKFGFVRNPWDREVSIYEDICQSKFNRLHKKVKGMTFSDYLNWRTTHPGGIRLQHKFLTDERKNLLVDFVGKFETLSQDYDTICDLIGIENKLQHKNKTSKRSDYRNYYDENTKNLVQNLCKEDIEMFGYSF